MKIATLGPKGTFSHEAVLKAYPNSEILFTPTIKDVFSYVKAKKADLGIVPIENSLSGSIGLSLDALLSGSLHIVKEILLPIRHHLASKGSLSKITHLYAQPQAFEQCQRFITKHLSEAEVRLTASNAKSAEKLARIDDSQFAAIVPEIAFNTHSIPCIAKNIQDSKHNLTRFVTLSRKETEPSGNDRCSIAVYPHTDKPGLLYSLLGLLADQKINLTKLESRPSKGKLGEYIFFIDFEGHQTDDHVKNAFKAIEKHFHLKILGSYPREY